jgi:acetoacetyl-CoA synthetase
LKAVVDRFGQVKPRVVFASTHYQYKGRPFYVAETILHLKNRIPSIETIVSVPYPTGTPVSPGSASIAGNGSPSPNRAAVYWSDLLGPDDDPEIEYVQVDFAHPLYIMFSSGTTGAPKCMVHGTGGTLITHRKEHELHCDLGPNDRLLYFTTCGWMMWNWQLTALSLGASIVCFDGNPAYPDLSSIWKTVNETRTTHFGTSGRHIESCMKGMTPDQLAKLDQLPNTRSILYTGSPLSETGYQWIFDSIKRDVHLAGIAGGTDIISCFVLGNPNLPVYAGEIQCRGLGVDVVAFDEDGRPIVGSAGELVCRQPLPSMPVSFLNDPDGDRYRAAYFEHFDGVWRHGDFVTITERGGAIMHGRSDATLNPGGVRIGSAELYAALDQVDFVTAAVAVGYQPSDQSDEVIVLLVALPKGEVLTDDRIDLVKTTIRHECSPRHVPRHVFQVSGIPVTRSGKTTELAVKAILHGRTVKNRGAMANPETLDEVEQIRDILMGR